MKKILLIFLLSTLPSIAFGNAFTQVKIGDVSLKYISYEIGSDIYNIKVAISDEARSLSDISSQYNAVSAINGIFFCPEDYRQCNGLNYTINERFVDGEDLSFYPDTGDRGVFGWGEDGVPFIHQTGEINPDKRADIYEGVGNFPILLENGQNKLGYYIENGLYDKKMQANASRHFICSNKDKTHIYIGRSSGVSLEGLIPTLRDLGCWDALNLDAGQSSHFNYNGREMVKGNRKVIDGIVIQREGLDVQIIEYNVHTMMLQIRPKFKQYPKISALMQLNYITDYIAKLRSSIYDNYSTDNYDEQGNYIGYTLEVTSLSDLEKIYTLNILERELKELYYEIRAN